MKVGERVRHPSLGEGAVVVTHTKGGQAGAVVDFGYMKDWVPCTELGRCNAGQEAEPWLPAPVPGNVRRSTPRNLPQLAQDVVDARRGVLALKLGQVLEQQVLKLSVGTSEIQENVEAVVSRAIERKTQGILFAGAWGSGKTHLLTMLNAVAVKQGMATSSVILDGEGVRLSDPMALMEAFLHSLRYPGESVPCGIGPRLRQLRYTGIHWTPAQAGERRILDAIRTVPADAFDEPGALQVLEDYFTFSLAATQANRKLSELGYRGVKLSAIRAAHVCQRANRFCELLQGWAGIVIKTGAKGLLLVVDEVDVEYASTAGRSAARKEERRRRTNLIWSLRNCLSV